MLPRQDARPWRAFWAKHVKEESVEPRPLYDLIDSTAETSPDRACLRYQGATLTYGQMRALSSRFAGALVSLGLERGQRVALFLPNVPQFVIAYFAILKAGGIVVPCSPLYKESELEQQLRDCGASIVIAVNDAVKGTDLYASVEGCRDRLKLDRVIAASVTDYLPPVKRRLARLGGVRNVKRRDTTRFVDLISRSRPIPLAAPVDPRKDVAVLQYTGGTTGISKGAMLTHANLYLNAAFTAKWFPLMESDIALSTLPFFHIYGMTATMNAPLYGHGTLVLMPRFDVVGVLRAIQDERVTCFCGVPTMYVAVINHEELARFSLRSVKGCISGGAALPIVVRKRFIEVTGGSLVEGYGLTEASPVTHCNPIGQDALVKEGSIGVPLPFTDARIVDLDDPGNVLGVGEVGELAVRGPQVMVGYWNMESETRNALSGDGWLLTGDIARMDSDGYFYIVDRKKDMIDVSGFKVYPREVEEVLFTHEAVIEAAVVGGRSEYQGETVVAYVVLKAGARATEREVIDFCRARLAPYKAPRSVFFVEELPKTLVGKVLRRRLREPP